MPKPRLQPGNSRRDPAVTASGLFVAARQSRTHKELIAEMQPRRILALLGATSSLALVAAGCGGGSGSPPVASVAGGATTAATPAPAPAGSSSGGPRAGFGLTLKTQNGLKFSQCMRAHGVAKFPDPSHDGSIQIGSSTGIDPSSSTFKSAQQACQELIGGGKPPSPAEQAKMRQQALAFSACMRRHGIADFPDPEFSNGRIAIRIKGGPGSNLNPSSPTFQAAQRACQGFLPDKARG
jgi:hypothetical protein